MQAPVLTRKCRDRLELPLARWKNGAFWVKAEVRDHSHHPFLYVNILSTFAGWYPTICTGLGSALTCRTGAFPPVFRFQRFKRFILSVIIDCLSLHSHYTHHRTSRTIHTPPFQGMVGLTKSRMSGFGSNSPQDP